MIKARFTKSIMENEEGMNHLWLQLSPVSDADDVRVQLTLPSGIHRLINLCGYEETDTQEIVVPNPSIENNLIFELFTTSPVPCGEKTVIVAITYYENEKHVRAEYEVPLRIVADEEMDGLAIDEEAAAFLKEHLTQQKSDAHSEYEFIDHSQTKIIRIESSEYAEWEKKYLIEGTHAVASTIVNDISIS